MSGSFVKGAVIGFVCALLGGATVALAGSGVGGVFNLGVSNSVDAKTTLTGASPGAQLRVDNTNALAGASGLVSTSKSSSPTGSFANSGGGPAGSFVVNAGVAPFTANSTGKVANLNADLFDGLNSTAFLRNQVPLTLTGAANSNGVIAATNTGGANGMQGKTGAASASGVYGENTGGGFGVGGVSNQAGGVGVLGEALGPNGHGVVAVTFGAGAAVAATNNGSGPALELHANGAPMTVDSSTRVDNLNADHLDGASIVSNRIISTTLNDHILQLPGFGDFNVVSCDHTNAVFQWSSGGPVAFVFWWDVLNSTDSFEGVANLVTSNPRPHHFITVQLARDVGGNTSIATVTLTTHAADCVFAAQAVVQPG
jgi:hypothetical protein